MAKSKFKTFSLPGLYHDLIVKLGPTKSVAKKYGDKNVLAFYEHDKCKITLGQDLETQVKLHTLCHEIAHHILDTLEPIEDEETRCDVLGSHLLRLIYEAREIIDANLKDPE